MGRLRRLSTTRFAALIAFAVVVNLPRASRPQDAVESHVLLPVTATIRESKGATVSVSGRVRVVSDVSSPDGHCLVSLRVDYTRLKGIDNSGRLYVIPGEPWEGPPEPCSLPGTHKIGEANIMVSRPSALQGGVRFAPLTLLFNLFLDDSGRLTDKSFVEVESAGNP